MKPLKVFLDTEFTNFFEPKLISLGMVVSTGEECYIEVAFPENECSPFVRETVIPLLGKYPNAYCSEHELRLRLLNWFEIVRLRQQTVEVCFDYETDWDLLINSLEFAVPTWLIPRNVGPETNELLLWDYWQKARTAGNLEQEHHALSDARALAYAYREHI